MDQGKGGGSAPSISKGWLGLLAPGALCTPGAPSNLFVGAPFPPRLKGAL